MSNKSDQSAASAGQTDRDELATFASEYLSKNLLDRDTTIERYRQLRREARSGYGRWILLIKELRVTHDSSILEAERVALSNPHRRCWVERSINTNQVCRKYALSHIRCNGEASLIERVGDTFTFKIK